MDGLGIRLFGGFRAGWAGAELSGLTSPRLQALLAWLLLSAGALAARRTLAFAFWPDSSEAQAMTNLRRELHHLRHCLPQAERFLEVTPQAVRWRKDAPYTLDTADFTGALEAARSDPARQVACLERAAQLYRGELLSGLHQDWLEPYRQGFHHQATAALEALSGLLEEAGEPERALGHAERLLTLEPYLERAHARSMRLHLARGDRAAALQAYQRCARALGEELGLRPSEEVETLYRRLRHDAPPPPPQPGGLPLVGRRGEWGALLAAWQEAQGGARALVICGEAGIGKTRLAQALYDHALYDHALSNHALSNPVQAARTRCYAALGRLAYAPLTDWLRSPALAPNLGRLEALWLTELARLVPELVQQHPEMAAPAPLSEGWQRQRFFEAAARAALSGGGPLLLMLDDVQWCDRDTLEWLSFLLRYAPDAPVLLLFTLRSEEEGDNPALGRLLLEWQGQGLVRRIALGPLDIEDSAELAAQVSGAPLPEEMRARLYAATEGHPLFIVEASRAGLAAQGDERLGREGLRREGAGLSVSPQVRAVIASRLAQLSDAARGVAQLAATVGRAFDASALRDAGDLDEEQLASALDELWRRFFIREVPGPAPRYDFSHDRLREGAYAELNPARRRLLHHRVAEALAAAPGGPNSAELAAHLEQAGLPERAIPHYLRAAERANDVSASQEAIRLAERALGLLEHLPAGRTRDQQELALYSAVIAALSASRGFTPPELEVALNRARALAERLGDEDALIRSMWGLYALHVVRGDVALARSLAEQALGLAGEDSLLLTDCHQALGGVDMTEGKLAEAKAHFEAANALYHRHSRRRVLFGVDVGVLSLAWGAHGLWLQGDIEGARSQVARAEAIAEDLGHPFTQMQASAYRAISLALERRPEDAWEAAETTVAGCIRHAVAYYHDWGVIIGGWAQALCGEPEAGEKRIRRGLDALYAQDAHLRRPFYLSLLAEVRVLRGRDVEARALLDGAAAFAQQNRDLWWLPEVWRMRGLLSPHGEAEAWLRRALALAREQGSRSLALRAAFSLAERLRGAGRPDEAVALLEPLCAAFPDALETPDLRAARALLGRGEP